LRTSSDLTSLAGRDEVFTHTHRGGQRLTRAQLQWVCTRVVIELGEDQRGLRARRRQRDPVRRVHLVEADGYRLSENSEAAVCEHLEHQGRLGVALVA